MKCSTYYSLLTAVGLMAAPLAGCDTELGDSQQLVDTAPADGDGGYCGGPDGTEAPTFSPFTDLPELLSAISTYSQNPALLYYGPTDGDPWTNWYLEDDMRHQLAKLAVMRGILDKYNLWDTYLGWFPPASCPADAGGVRQIDGTCNSLDKPFMGARGARFGRNFMPLQAAAHHNPATVMDPNPREVSRHLFTREGDMKEVPFLNLLAAAWIQFQVHDWFNHEQHGTEMWQIPLADDDPFRVEDGREAMYVRKTLPDPTRQPHEVILPPTYQNEVTHWWDGSQLYGSDAATANRLRAFEGGRLAMDANGMLPTAADGFEDTGFRNNWWVGLGLMHNLFAHEHNAIADMLAEAYPDWTDQQIYDKARMINAAVIVKIHTIEWTPAILPNPALEVGMNANWRGLNQYFEPPIPGSMVPPALSSVVNGVAGNSRDLKVYPTSAELQAAGVPAAQANQIAAVFTGEVPFSLTEEFVSVYRMHSLLPDVIKLHDVASGHRIGAVPLHQVRDADARALEEAEGLLNLMYSFGVEHPGQLVLENYPSLLQNLDIPFLGKLDIGAVDVLRDRERGVPRYNEFRRQLNLRPLTSIDELTPDPALRAKLAAVYGGDIEKVDALVGFMAEGTRPTCYGFGETLFQVFTVMATRRIQADRFYTDDFTPEVYTPEGMAWIENATMKQVLLRHFPELGNTGLADVTNAFYPWE
jgi:hypothetical protein